MARPSSLTNRLLAVGLLAATVAIIYLLVVAPVMAKFAGYRDSIEQSRDLYAKYQGISAGGDELEAQLEEIKRRDAAAGGYVMGASETLAAAELQNHIKAVFNRNGATLKSLQILPTEEEEEGFLRIIVRAQLTAAATGLQQVIFALEADKPYLFIENVDIRKQRQRRKRTRTRRPATPQPTYDPGLLDIRFDVFGYMRTPTG